MVLLILLPVTYFKVEVVVKEVEEVIMEEDTFSSTKARPDAKIVGVNMVDKSRDKIMEKLDMRVQSADMLLL